MRRGWPLFEDICDLLHKIWNEDSRSTRRVIIARSRPLGRQIRSCGDRWMANNALYLPDDCAHSATIGANAAGTPCNSFARRRSGTSFPDHGTRSDREATQGSSNGEFRRGQFPMHRIYRNVRCVLPGGAIRHFRRLTALTHQEFHHHSRRYPFFRF